MKKLAFCFLIYDEILNEELWYNFFKDIDPNKYTIYIHYKTYKPLKYFERYRLSPQKLIETEYGGITLVQAHRRLFEEAYIDFDNYKFINISQACIPLKSFNYIYDFLTKDDNSYFNECNKNDCWPRIKPAARFISRDKIYKSTNWFILNKKHVRLCLESISKEFIFNKVGAAEEHYFITLVKNKDNTDVVYLPDNTKQSTTFTNWNNGKLKNYTSINIEEIDELLNASCLFGRKFLKGCIVEMNDGNILLEDYLIEKI